jgi:hypothetical protein
MKRFASAHKVKRATEREQSLPVTIPFASAGKRYRISGHESFSCRYAWLPKVVHLLQQGPAFLGDDEKAMVELGLGKNMVRSARFWAHAIGIIESYRSEISLTQFGDLLLGKGDLDPFLEDICTLWLLHWRLSTDIDHPLLAWDYLFNRWQEPELIPSHATKMLYKEASKYDEGLSIVTLQQHFDVFLHSYVPTRGKKGKVQEENLDCPLVELDLLQRVGDRGSLTNDGERESVYIFRREEKPDITQELFAYCLADYWLKRHPTEHTLAFREMAHGHGSPGQVFKLPEEDIKARLEVIETATAGCFTYVESAQLQQVRRTEQPNMPKFLKNIYAKETSYVK